MNLTKYLTLGVFLFSFANCAAIQPEAKVNDNKAVTIENVNTATNSEKPTTNSNVQAQTATPEALIKDLYKTHKREDVSIVQGEDRSYIDKYFDKNLGGLIWKDQTTNQEFVGVIDFDIFYNTQDPAITNLVVGAAKVTGDKATVPVTFLNDKTKYAVTYSLVKENSAWKIADIGYGKGESLLKYFKTAADAEAEDAKNAAKNSPHATEFSGKYQVGTTTCTVTPVKMAFEVKWEKGSGTEVFFFKDNANEKHNFTTNTTNGKANVFSFDDENYTTGTFYRGDGKQFPIKRIN